MDEAQIVRICEKLDRQRECSYVEGKFRPCKERDASKIYEELSRYQFDSRSRSDEGRQYCYSKSEEGCLVIDRVSVERVKMFVIC